MAEEAVDDQYEPLLRATVTGYHDDVVRCLALEKVAPGQTGIGTRQASVEAEPRSRPGAVDN